MLARGLVLSFAGAFGALACAGCSGGAVPGGQTLGPASPGAVQSVRHGWISPAAKKLKLLYVSDYTQNLILIYQQGATGNGPIGEILDGVSQPQGIAVDSSGTLYVANEGNNTIAEYPAGSTSPSMTLSTDITSPLDVTVDSKGVIYVIEGSSDLVVEFKPGSDTPDAVVSIVHPSEGTNAKNDDLFVTHNQSSVGRVDQCKPLKTKCKDLGIGVEFAQGIALDLKGNLLVGDYFGGVIDIYAPGTNTPFRTIPTPEEEPGKLAFDSNDATLYMADPANFTVRLIDYASGDQITSFTFGSGDELEGVALFPGQKPGK
jgi:DNA-binding beta-propeller fold protein YncE